MKIIIEKALQIGYNFHEVKYLGLHKINGRKGEGAHCRVAVGEGLRASFGKNLGGTLLQTHPFLQ